MLLANTQQKMEMILTIISYGKKHQFYIMKIIFTIEILLKWFIYVKKECINSINKITVIENLNKSYNMLLDLFSWENIKN